MTHAVLPNESRRMEAVRRYDILDTPPDGSFDQITAMAAKLFSTPISIISLMVSLPRPLVAFQPDT